MSLRGKAKTCIVIPSYNEEKTLPWVIQKARNVADLVIVVDDASTDETRLLAQANGAQVISHKTNRGYGAAIKTGIKVALRAGCEYTGIFSGDGQVDPRDFPRFLNEFNQGVDHVKGSRFLGIKAQNMPLHRMLGNIFLTALLNLLIGFNFSDALSGPHVFHRRVFEKIDLEELPDGYNVDFAYLIQAREKGIRIQEVPSSVYYAKSTHMTPFVSFFEIARPLFEHMLGHKSRRCK